jgi:hypothetical protein
MYFCNGNVFRDQKKYVGKEMIAGDVNFVGRVAIAERVLLGL